MMIIIISIEKKSQFQIQYTHTRSYMYVKVEIKIISINEMCTLDDDDDDGLSFCVLFPRHIQFGSNKMSIIIIIQIEYTHIYTIFSIIYSTKFYDVINIYTHTHLKLKKKIDHRFNFG